ncbi:hypothetical protein S40288_09846 [Stachybotrys chartarum IBT 40288]|nr:hypothetical protein S40288_09846 [Stachybotrys chartarum IBT 40288]
MNPRKGLGLRNWSHHPVHLQDVLNKRYQVIHKLGSGGYANVWLCRDMSANASKYVATKIIMAEGSTAECAESRVIKLVEAGCERETTATNLSLPLDQFEINGPNGTHSLRKICHEAVQAMATLHAHGICLGDFRPANILARIGCFDGLSEKAVLGVLGTPSTTKVTTVSGESHDVEGAPKYLVYPINWDEVLANPGETKLMTGSACLTDFGKSFHMSTPPATVGTPQVYCSPEQVLEQKVGGGTDVWALGCTLFEIRTGRKLFDTFENDRDECLCKIATILGKYPEPWWSKTWELRRQFFEDNVDAAGMVVEVKQEWSTEQTNHAEVEGNESHVVILGRAESRSLQEALSRRLVYESNHGPEALHRDISTEETEVFADLLAQLLEYDAEKRPSANDVLQHRWFTMGAQ